MAWARHLCKMNNNRGVALFLTLALISVLTAAALEVGRRSGKAAARAIAAADAYQAREMAQSGIQLAMAMLADDAAANDIDSLQEPWADEDKCAAAVAALGFPPESLTIAISDELGKIQVNALLKAFPGNAFNEDQRRLWERFLDLAVSADKSLDDRDPSEIINALKDWLDSGDDDAVTGVSGAEAAYYEGLEPPVHCANAPFDSLGELFFVKGISENFVQKKENSLSDEAVQEIPPMDTLLSVHGMTAAGNGGGRYVYPGRININTAGEAVLSALLPTGMADQAAELVEFRMEQEETGEGFINRLDKGWYNQVIQLTEKEKEAFERIITYSAFVFSVSSVALLNGHATSFTGIVKREKNEESGKWTCRLLELWEN